MHPKQLTIICMTSQKGNHDKNLSSMFSLFHWCTGSFGMTVKARRNVYNSFAD